MSVRTALIPDSELTLVSASSSIAFPALATDGVPTASWLQGATVRRFGFPESTQFQAQVAHVDAAVFMESSVAQTLSAGVGLYGYRNSTGKWYLLAGVLNTGAAIQTLGAATGFAQEVSMASVFDRLAIGSLAAAAVTPSSGTVTFKICLIRQEEN